MAAPYLGGHAMLSAAWSGPSSLRVRFSTTYGTTYLYQLYAGRTLVGVTESESERTVVGEFSPSVWPQWLQLLAVTRANQLTDYGSTLPPRPYNRCALAWTVAADANTDNKFIDIVSGTAPGGAVVQTNLLKRLEYAGPGNYAWTTLPVAGSGTWNFEVSQRDNKLGSTKWPGNEGTALAIQATNVLSTPPDFARNTSGQRFTVSVSGGVATVGVTYPV